jgi:hypothetical protein
LGGLVIENHTENTKVQVINTSIVIGANEHNPSILHPSFLTSQEIVPIGWDLAEKPVCTPPFSIVKYKNGIIFNVESNKFQLVDNNPPEHFASSRAPELALKYIRKLPHVRYTAVGINFAGFIAMPAPETRLIDRFLKSGPWNDSNHKLNALGLHFVYSVSQGILNLRCDPGMVKRNSEADRSAIILSANYHTVVSGAQALSGTEKAIELFSERSAHYIEVTKTLFGLGD